MEKSTAVRLTRDEAIDIANALNTEATHFDQLRKDRAADVPEQTLLVWRDKSESNRELSRRIVLHF